MKIPLGEFAPDIGDVNQGVLSLAQNVLPGSNSYQPAPGLNPLTDPLTDNPKGLYNAVKIDGSGRTYAGDDKSLYVRDDETWEDATRSSGAYSVQESQYWCFKQFGTTLYATHKDDAMQFIDIEAAPGEQFDDAPGSPPLCGQIEAIDDYLVASDQVNAPDTISWCDTNDPTNWTTGNADSQQFPAGGPVKFVAGAAKLVIQENTFRRIIVTGDTDVFQFDEVETGRGTICPYSVVPFGGGVAYYSDAGFILATASEQRTIGQNKINRYFAERVFPTRISQVFGTFDPKYPRFYWSYPTEDVDRNQRILVYDWSVDHWADLDIETFVLAATAQPGVTLEGLDDISASLDALQASLDSNVWSGGRPNLSAFGADKMLGYFNGSSMEALLRTGRFNFNEGRRSFVQGARLVTDAENHSIRVRKRQKLSDPGTWTSASSVQSSGYCPLRASGFYHEIEATIPEGEVWSHLQSLEVDAVPEGVR
jgi:hypothetical protein